MMTNEETMYNNLFSVINNDPMLMKKYLQMVKSILKQVSEQHIKNVLEIYPDFFDTFSRVSTINDDVAISNLFDWKSPLFQEIIQKEWKASVFGNIYHAPSVIFLNYDIQVRSACIKADKSVLFSPYRDLDKNNLNDILHENDEISPYVLYKDDNYGVSIDYVYSPQPNQRMDSLQHQAKPTVKINILSRTADGFVVKSKYSLKGFSNLCKKIPSHPMAMVADALGYTSNATSKE